MSGTEKREQSAQKAGDRAAVVQANLPCLNSWCAVQAGSAERLFPACVGDEKRNSVEGTPQR